MAKLFRRTGDRRSIALFADNVDMRLKPLFWPSDVISDDGTFYEKLFAFEDLQTENYPGGGLVVYRSTERPAGYSNYIFSPQLNRLFEGPLLFVLKNATYAQIASFVGRVSSDVFFLHGIDPAIFALQKNFLKPMHTADERVSFLRYFDSYIHYDRKHFSAIDLRLRTFAMLIGRPVQSYLVFTALADYVLRKINKVTPISDFAYSGSFLNNTDVDRTSDCDVAIFSEALDRNPSIALLRNIEAAFESDKIVDCRLNPPALSFNLKQRLPSYMDADLEVVPMRRQSNAFFVLSEENAWDKKTDAMQIRERTLSRRSTHYLTACYAARILKHLFASNEISFASHVIERFVVGAIG
jgi:hypothetical protein